MKKIIISTSVALVLIVGFFVGQSELTSSSGTKSTSSDYSNGGSSDYSGTYSDVASNSNSRSGSSSDYSNSRTEVQTNTADVASKEMSAPGSIKVGDPLSKDIVKVGTIDITIEKDELTKNYDKLIKIISPDGGYVEQDSSTQHSAIITVRIPSDKLDANLVALRDLGTVTARSINSEDRAYSVKDYEARLSILMQRKDVLLAALAKATVSDALNIQEQIFSVQSEIESITGQQELLAEQISYATITVTLTEKGEKLAYDESDKKSLLGKSWETASNSLLVSFGGIVILLGAIFPFLILMIIALLIYRAMKKKKEITETAI